MRGLLLPTAPTISLDSNVLRVGNEPEAGPAIRHNENR